MMYAATPSAEIGPRFCARDAVPRIVLTRPAVSTSSISIACVSFAPAPGTVAPSLPTRPNTARRKRTASVAPITWTTT